jgi:hypothetical protein
MPLKKAILTIEADVDGDGNAETGEFHFVDGVEIIPSMRTGFLLDNRGSTANSVLSDTVADDVSNRKGIYLDLGGGVRSVEISFSGWTGSDVRWGDTGDPSTTTQTDATGASALTQLEVLFQYLAVAEVDSRNPATLEYGEHHSDGLYEPLDVVLESPSGQRSSDQSSTFSGTLTFLETVKLGDALDGTKLEG